MNGLARPHRASRRRVVQSRRRASRQRSLPQPHEVVGLDPRLGVRAVADDHDVAVLVGENLVELRFGRLGVGTFDAVDLVPSIGHATRCRRWSSVGLTARRPPRRDVRSRRTARAVPGADARKNDGAGVTTASMVALVPLFEHGFAAVLVFFLLVAPFTLLAGLTTLVAVAYGATSVPRAAAASGGLGAVAVAVAYAAVGPIGDETRIQWPLTAAALLALFLAAYCLAYVGLSRRLDSRSRSPLRGRWSAIAIGGVATLTAVLSLLAGLLTALLTVPTTAGLVANLTPLAAYGALAAVNGVVAVRLVRASDRPSTVGERPAPR